MARDRLAALRAQQENATPSNSYPSQASGSGNGSQTRKPVPPVPRDDGSYEMADTTSNGPPPPMTAEVGDMTAFYSEISSVQDALRRFNDNVAEISSLHSRLLYNMDDAAAQQNSAQLNELVEETSGLSTSLKQRIKAMETQGGPGRDGQIKRQQAAFIKSKFTEAIQNYQSVEQQYRTKYRERMERQFKIINPNATSDEVRAVLDDDQGGQLFSQALIDSRYTAESRAAYREVQGRHEDVTRIEKTLAELAQISNEMSAVVERQDETVNAIHTGAEDTEANVEAGAKHTEQAVVSARSYRKKRIYLAIALFILAAVIALVVGLAVSQTMTKRH
ncbi:hypothetical protein GALMADRAFT_250740 [Galerina marginata CBS 339.88]|uniref:t-SNARE coiled-coil homology domain-containing protein n=1 Tax=Galerina marginata (strain CBS 339.88) TaxID=685588 RepID=A0A067SVE7_GALM3|nr:hypothetical protein GALMADRAFT_250740 [Galerina marginata CBS 339.88]